jgi:hypothetical protein
MNPRLLFNSGIYLEHRRIERILQSDPTLGTRKKRLHGLLSVLRRVANAVYVRLAKSGEAPVLNAAQITAWLSSGLPISMGTDALMALEQRATAIREETIIVLKKYVLLANQLELRERLIEAVEALAQTKPWQTF